MIGQIASSFSSRQGGVANHSRIVIHSQTRGSCLRPNQAAEKTGRTGKSNSLYSLATIVTKRDNQILTLRRHINREDGLSKSPFLLR